MISSRETDILAIAVTVKCLTIRTVEFAKNVKRKCNARAEIFARNADGKRPRTAFVPIARKIYPNSRAVFRRLTKKAFEHRRKQLGSIFKDLIQSTARAEELTNEDWINLSKGITQNENA